MDRISLANLNCPILKVEKRLNELEALETVKGIIVSEYIQLLNYIKQYTVPTTKIKAHKSFLFLITRDFNTHTGKSLRMYDRVLNKDSMANEVVNIIRCTTDAPLKDCIQAAKLLVSSLSAFVRDENFSAICSALDDFKLNLEECYDSQLLAALGGSLSDFFKEKEELSYSVSDVEELMLDNLDRFTSCIAKTHESILLRFLSVDDFSFLGTLISSYQMDQNVQIQLSVLKCLTMIAKNCPESIPYLLESQLPIVIVSKLSTIDRPLTEYQFLNIRLLTLIYQSGLRPPLEHFTFLNSDFVEKLLPALRDNSELIIGFLSAINASVPLFEENPVLIGLSNSDHLQFGELFINELNQNYGVKPLHLLLNICRSERDILQQLFYSNDLQVLSRILARELVNSDTKETRQPCFDCIKELVKQGIYVDTTKESIEQCLLEEDDKNELLSLISNS